MSQVAIWLYMTIETWTTAPAPWEIGVWAVLTLGFIVAALNIRRGWNK